MHLHAKGNGVKGATECVGRNGTCTGSLGAALWAGLSSRPHTAELCAFARGGAREFKC